MVKQKAEEPKKGAPEYMSTYGDFVTLLLCFFVLLFAMSTVDAKKFEAIASSLAGNPVSINTAGGKDTVKDLLGSGLMQMPSIVVNKKATSNEIARQQQAMEELKSMSSDLKTYFAENNVAEQIQVEIRDNQLVLTFEEGVLFDSGRANLKQASISILDIVATELLKFPNCMLNIEGHTDNVPINTIQFPSNWHLSAARAVAVGSYFMDDKGFPRNSVAAIARGEYVPVASNDTPEGRAKNRRVEIYVKTMETGGINTARTYATDLEESNNNENTASE